MRIVRPSSLAMAGITLAITLSVSTATASAASAFLLQFGTHKTEEAAHAQWETLHNQYPDLLGKLEMHIASIDQQFRTQASGVTSRETAHQTCNRLMTDKVECHVVETSMYSPAASDQDALFAPLAPVEENISTEMGAATLEDAPLAPQPDIAAAEPAPVQAPQEKTFRESLLPWLGFGDKEENAAEAAPQPVVTAQAEPLRPQRVERPAEVEAEERAAVEAMSESLPAPVAPPVAAEADAVASRAPRPLQVPQDTVQQDFAETVTPQEAPAQDAHAQVEIAEAIQVPLSFGNAAPVPVNKPVGYGGFPSQPLPARALWVQMSHFTSKEAAMQYWRQLSAQNPEMMRLLRVRIVAPWRTAGTQKTASLRMGPFTNRDEINRICGSAEQSKLRCTLVQEVGSSAAATTVRTQGNHENYNLSKATSRSYSRAAGTPPSGMYWLQLGAFDSVATAQQRWDVLTTTHKDILGRMQPQISYPALSSSPTPVYHLRTGPFVNKASALDNCANLQNRYIGCIVVQSR